MTRLRSAAQRAPQTKEQATVLAARFATIAGVAGVVSARRAQAHARIDAICDAQLVPMAAEQADIVKQLKPWFSANQQALCGDKRKSIELAGCVLGYRISPPSVNFAGGKDEFAVAALVGADLQGDLVRTKLSSDKEAILKLLQLVAPVVPAETAPIEIDPVLEHKLATKAALLDLGFSVKQPELFFVDLSTKDEPSPASIASDDEVA